MIILARGVVKSYIIRLEWVLPTLSFMQNGLIDDLSG